MSNEGTSWWALGLDNTKFQADADKSNAIFKSIGNTAESEGARIDTIFKRATAAATGFFTLQQATNYATKIAQVRGEFQQLEVAFNTMLRSKSKADALMNQAVDMAAKTPFDLKGVASGAKQLLAYGVASEDVTKRLEQLGNIASGLSIPLNDIVYLYGTTMVQGRLFTQDVRQFMGRGIPLVQELAKELGKTENEINAMVTAGKIGFPEVQRVLDNLTKSGGMFYNLMADQSKTITGQISNLGDALETMYNKIGESQEGVISDAIGGASYLVENYEEVGRIITELVTTYGAYKAILMTISALEKSTTVIKATAEAEELANLLTIEQKATISKQNLTKGSLEYAAAVKAEVTAEMDKQTALAATLKSEIDSSKIALSSKQAAVDAAMSQVSAAEALRQTREKELANLITVTQAEKASTMQKELDAATDKARAARKKAISLLSQQQAAITAKIQAEETGASKTKVASLEKEIHTINRKLVTAKQEALAANEVVAAKRREIAATDGSVSSKQIEAAQKRLNVAITAQETAAENLNTAATEKNTVASQLSAKYTALDSTLTQVNTLETGLNTAGKKANVTLTNILATAKTRLIAVAVKLNRVIMNNPYTIAAAAVAVLGYGIYKLITYQTEAEKAQAKLNKTIADSEKSIDSERNQIDAMFARLKAAKNGTDEYRAAKEAIMNKYGEYLKGLGDEKNALDDLAKAYKTITEEAAKSAKARAMETATKGAADDLAETQGDARSEVKKLLDKKFKGLKDKDGVALSEVYFWKIEPVLEGKAEITKDIEDIVNKFDETKYVAGDTMHGIGAYTYTANALKEEITKTQKARGIFENVLSEARIQFGENKKKDEKTTEKPFDPEGKKVAELDDAIIKEKDKLKAYQKALKENNGLAQDGTKVTDEMVASQEQFIKTLKDTMLAREADLKIIREVEDRIDLLKKEQKETVKDSPEYNDYQKRIDSLTTKIPSKKTKEDKDYTNDLRKDALEKIRAMKDMDFLIRQAQINNQKDGLSKTLEQNQLNYEKEMDQIKRQEEDKLMKMQEWEKTVWKSKGEKGKFSPTTTELPQPDKDQFDTLKKETANNFTYSNQVAIEEMLKQYQTYADKRKAIEKKFQKDIDSMKDENDKATKEGRSAPFSNETIGQANKDKQDALDELDNEIASREATFNVWADKIANMGIKQLKSALQTAKETLDKDDSAMSEKEKAILRAQIKTLEKKLEVAEAKDASMTSAEKSKKKWDNTLKTMNEVQDAVDNIVSSFDGLDEVTKVALTSATNIAGGVIAMITGIQALSTAASEGIKAVERASVILAIIGAAVQIITALFSLTSKAEKEHQEALKEVAENKLKMQREYNLLLMEQNLLMKEATSIFGEDQIAKAARAIEVYRQALSDYREELKGNAPERNKTESMFYKFTGADLDSYTQKIKNYQSGMGSLLNDVQVKTGSYTTGAWFWKKQHDVMTPVLQVYKDLVDEEGNLNIERAKAIIETQTMTDESKSQLQALIDLQEQAKEAQEELRNYLEDTFGSLGPSIMDSITEAIENNGVSAWEKFREKGSDVLEDLGKQIAYSLFFSDKFKRLQADLEKIYGSGKTEEEIAKDARNLVASFYNTVGTDMNNAQQWMEGWKEEAKKQGFDLWSSTREASSKGVNSVDQETGSEIAGRATAIQGHTYQINEGVKELVANSAKILDHLAGIEKNTDHLEEINENIKSVKSDISDMNLKGVNLK